MSLPNDSFLSSQKTGQAGALDINEENFVQEVLEGSLETPILLQFFVPNDPACEKLKPVLEKITAGTKGAVRLGQLNILQNRALARQLVQSGLPLNNVPLTALFAQGKIIDLFQEFQPSEFVQKFLEKALKKLGIALPAFHIVAQGQKALGENRPDEACAYFGEALENDPENPFAWNGLLRALIAMGEIEGAKEAALDIPEKILEHPEIKGAKAALEIAGKKGSALSELENLEKEARKSPDNIEAQCRLADALNAAGEPERAADILLTIIGDKSKSEETEQARKNLLHFFEAWGENDLTRRCRRRLSSLLFA